MAQTELRYRQAFAVNRSHSELRNPHLMLIDVFANPRLFVLGQVRDAAQIRKGHTRDTARFQNSNEQPSPLASCSPCHSGARACAWCRPRLHGRCRPSQSCPKSSRTTSARTERSCLGRARCQVRSRRSSSSRGTGAASRTARSTSSTGKTCSARVRARVCARHSFTLGRPQCYAWWCDVRGTPDTTTIIAVRACAACATFVRRRAAHVRDAAASRGGG